MAPSDPAWRAAALAGIGIDDRGLLRIEDAAAFVETCAAHGYAILGGEGFEIGADGSVLPRMDAILSAGECLSPNWQESVRRTAAAARAYVRAIRALPVTHVEFVLEEAPRA